MQLTEAVYYYEDTKRVLRRYAVKRVMRLSDMQLSGFDYIAVASTGLLLFDNETHTSILRLPVLRNGKPHVRAHKYQESYNLYCTCILQVISSNI